MIRHRFLLSVLLFFIWTTSAVSQMNYQYSYTPKKVFETQVFPVTIVADADERKNPPTFKFDPQSPVKPLESRHIIDSNGGKTFYTFYFNAKNSDITIPELTINSKDEVVMLRSRSIPVRKLDTQGHDEFCGLIATSCKIVTSQVSEFDDQNNLVSMTIKASEANPSEIKINNSIESGIEGISRSGSDVTIEYYFVIPSSQKSVTLSYYNTLQNRFISKTISTDYKNNPVAAQENLNPTDSSFDKLKKYGLSFLAIFFILMFLVKKDFFFLVLFAICAIILFTIFTPHEKVCIQEGSAIYIVPTAISTTSGRIDRELTTNILNRRGEYYKIEYDNNIIGWIKDEDTCKD